MRGGLPYAYFSPSPSFLSASPLSSTALTEGGGTAEAGFGFLHPLHPQLEVGAEPSLEPLDPLQPLERLPPAASRGIRKVTPSLNSTTLAG